jgi:hypothetical protein
VKIAYFHCFSGISGDMVLGALVDAGWPLGDLKKKLACLSLAGYNIKSQKVKRGALEATKIKVEVKGKQRHHRRLEDIKKIIRQSPYDASVKAKAVTIFESLARAEAKIHGVSPQEVHFHEVGAVDAIVDIVGSVLGLEALGIEEVYASPLNVGGGTVVTAHGLLPVPAPATLELLKGVPLYQEGEAFERVTPTGAAILRAYARSFGPPPAMTVEKVGYGAGERQDAKIPNVLRLVLGQSAASPVPPAWEEEVLWELSCNLDDMNPQFLEFALEELLNRGAVDVFFTPIVMKKSRPATMVSVLAREGERDPLISTLMTYTTTLGVRAARYWRRCLYRREQQVKIPGGKVRVKVVQLPDGKLRAAPEYEDCKRLAKAGGISPQEVWHQAQMAFNRSFKKQSQRKK